MPPTEPKPRKALLDSHVGDKTENLRVALYLVPPMFVVLTLIELLLFFKGVFTSGILGFFLVVVNPVMCVAGAWFLRHALEWGAHGLIGGLLSTRGTAHTREFSEMESLIVRGEFAEAAERYRAHLVAFPTDTDAWLRLAVLTGEQLRDADAAIAHFRRARESGPTPQQETLIGNNLIDLHRARGEHHELRAELARFARLHQHSAAGRHALEALKGMPS